MEKYRAIGLMSGTSLDGLDVAACEFTLDNGKWSFSILHSHTYPYSAEWKAKLASLPSTDALTFSYINVEYGHLLGRLTRNFLDQISFKPDLVASHGHTVFHQPGHGLTVQVGAGSAIAAEAGLPVICDFRSMDVALGGQGAPLVPIGDRLLFSDFDACLNLGGFANISMEWKGERMAFDVCPANIILNRLSSIIGYDYDKDGNIARSGALVPEILARLDSLPYYKQKGPRSLGREWLEQFFLPVIGEYKGLTANLLRTSVEHIANQVQLAMAGTSSSKVLVTGGGVHNTFLLEKIRENNKHQWIKLSDEISDFKEALVFAFLGVLRLRGEKNVMRSVTGGRKDHSGGAICLPA